MRPRRLRTLLFSALLLCCGATIARSDDARIYLSWGAGHGLPGAAGSLTRTGGDTTRVDTLYLSFSPGRACSTFVGMTATLWLRAMDGDSLGPLWQSAGGMTLPRGMSVEFPRDSASAHPFPWAGFGIGHSGYGRSGSNAGRLRLMWAVGPQDGARVEPGRLYGLARILLRRPAAGAPGSAQPVCVEWSEGSMAYRPGDEPGVSAGVRYVGINAAGGEFSCSTETSPTPPAPPAPRAGKARKAPSGR